MLRVNYLKRVLAVPVVAKRNFSAAANLQVLAKYGIVPATGTKVFRNLSYDDIFAQGKHLANMSQDVHARMLASVLVGSWLSSIGVDFLCASQIKVFNSSFYLSLSAI